MAQHLDPPSHWKGILRYLGPGLIITASIVGSGELIVTPKLGSEVGFSLLWFIIIGCMVKVLVQIELGRHAIISGQTTIQAMDSMPGPRVRVSWMVWFWLAMFLSLPFQVAGMMGAIAKICTLAGAPESWETAWVVMVGVGTALLLAVGRYKLVQNVSTGMVVLFTLFTVFALVAVQTTDYSITTAQIVDGLSFQMPDKFMTAFAAFGIIGVGASELIYYPYWCLEKGYARHVGTDVTEGGWLKRVRGWITVMKADAWLSLAVYTGATVAFYLLGAAVLFGQGKVIEDNSEVIPYLSEMYTQSFGQIGLMIFLFGGMCVLFSTVFAATASNARLLIDGLRVYKIREAKDSDDQAKLIKYACIGLAMASMVIYLTFQKVVWLVFVGAVAQGLMLPFLASAALYYRIKHKKVICHEDKPGKFKFGTALLTISMVSMGAVGLYQTYGVIAEMLK